jgi:tetratricopeptide (TPR) repeat protein
MLYKAGSNLIWPHLQFANRLPARAEKSKIDLENGIAKLKSALRMRPSNTKNWSTYWLLGKAYEALGNFEDSYQSFTAAYKINSGHVDVLRELMASCLNTGRTAEAVSAAKVARDLAPLDAGIIANLALAFLKNGQQDEALVTGREALRLAPSDVITRALVSKIEQAAIR